MLYFDLPGGYTRFLIKLYQKIIKNLPILALAHILRRKWKSHHKGDFLVFLDFVSNSAR